MRSIEEDFAALQKDREAVEDEQTKKNEKHPRCAILPSPEKLDESIGSPGSDKTDTLRDFDLIKDWVTNSELLNTGFYDWDGIDGENLEEGVYYSFIRLAFSVAFDAMRNTKSPELEELVFWYYAGHGLGKESAQKLSYSSTPYLNGRVNPDYHKAANDFVKEGRKVKGGELCLHRVGFCDLYGLLKPWIAAVKTPSINAEGCSKKNKHLVIILDSCYSGKIAQELKDFEEHMNKQCPNFLQENSVTIQAACCPDQRALGGYFTPCFICLNDPKNAELLNKLKTDWMDMTPEEKHEYRSIQLPSPMVVTTRTQSQDFSMELTIQDFKLTLFPDSGFFKFCSMKVYQHDDERMLDGKDRVLNSTSAQKFMTSQPFTVLDYKLKRLATGTHAGTPMGLFLLQDHNSPGYTVCAHIHFAMGNTNNPQRINLVHHKKAPMVIMSHLVPYMYIVDGKKFQVLLGVNAQNLVQACRVYVESKEPGRWNDVSRWNMKGHQFGVNGLFRVRERQKQRSAWEDSYLKHIEQYHLPMAASN